MKNRRRMAIIVTAMLAFAFLGFRLFDIFTNSVLSVYNVRWKLSIVEKTNIDLFGGVLPTVISLFFALYLIRFRGFSTKLYLREFLFAIAFAFLVSSVSTSAVVVRFKMLTLLVSLSVVFITYYDRGFAKFLRIRDLSELEFTRKNFVNALLLAFSYSSLSVLIVDLAYLPFAASAYIGAMGLTDAIMLSGLVTPICLPIATMFVMFLCELSVRR